MLPEKYTSDNISFLSNEEREIVKKEITGKYHQLIRAKGAYIIAKPYISPKKTSGGIYIPDTAISEDKFHSQICQVIDLGPLAYTSEKYIGTVSWCDIGDWVIIPRVAGARVMLSDNEEDCLRIVQEHEILAVIKDPNDFRIKISATKY